MSIRSAIARAAVVGGFAAIGLLGLSAGAASAQQSPSPSPSPQNPGGQTSTTAPAVTPSSTSGGTGGARHPSTGLDPSVLAAVGGGGAAIALGVRQLARRAT